MQLSILLSAAVFTAGAIAANDCSPRTQWGQHAAWESYHLIEQLQATHTTFTVAQTGNGNAPADVWEWPDPGSSVKVRHAPLTSSIPAYRSTLTIRSCAPQACVTRKVANGGPTSFTSDELYFRIHDFIIPKCCSASDSIW